MQPQHDSECEFCGEMFGENDVQCDNCKGRLCDQCSNGVADSGRGASVPSYFECKKCKGIFCVYCADFDDSRYICLNCSVKRTTSSSRKDEKQNNSSNKKEKRIKYKRLHVLGRSKPDGSGDVILTRNDSNWSKEEE